MVASAGKNMASKLCAGWLRAGVCTVAIVVAYYWPQAYTFPALIILGGLATLAWSWLRKEPVPPSVVRLSPAAGGGARAWAEGAQIAARPRGMTDGAGLLRWPRRTALPDPSCPPPRGRNAPPKGL
jgi:hypothetical protein